MLLLDDDYIEGIHNGDERIFTALVRAHSYALTRFAFGFTGLEDDAHDAVQEVFARLWELGDRWKPKGSVSGYLYTAVRNRMLNTLRSQDARQRMQHAWSVEVSDAYQDSKEGVVDTRIENVNRAFDLLTERQREVLRLRYDHQLSVPQVAEVLEINVRAAERLIARALKLLRTQAGERSSG